MLQSRCTAVRSVGTGWLFPIAVSLCAAGCYGDVDKSLGPPPTRTLAEHLIGTWQLVSRWNFPIPGWVRYCIGGQYGCDTTFITSGELAFEPGTRCSRTITWEPDEPSGTVVCRYQVGSTTASVLFGDDHTYYTLDISQDPVTNEWLDEMTLWGPRCGMWEYPCREQFREDYRKATP